MAMATGAESMVFSALLSKHVGMATHAESMILSVWHAESMINIAHAESIILSEPLLAALNTRGDGDRC